MTKQIEFAHWIADPFSVRLPRFPALSASIDSVTLHFFSVNSGSELEASLNEKKREILNLVCLDLHDRSETREETNHSLSRSTVASCTHINFVHREDNS